ncbi:hypothetical protein ASD37_16190 [Mycobacterium sp. Root135]|nr:hypothetical protein ASD37_16190 [Mycobacterium sp. Root135]
MILDTRDQVHDESDSAGSDRTAKMPRRRRTRAHQRAHDITAERTANHHQRTTTPAAPALVDDDPSPPPF